MVEKAVSVGGGAADIDTDDSICQKYVPIGSHLVNGREF
jgi:hypothetical protein